MEALNCCKKKEPPSPTDSESLGEYFAVGDTGTVEMDTLTGGSINRPNGGNRKKKAKRKADRLPSLLPIKDYEVRYWFGYWTYQYYIVLLSEFRL
jgi:hypothetical protein